VTYRANARREAIRQLAELRARLDAAEDALTAAKASLKQAHTRFDAADDQVAAARTPCTPPTPIASKPSGTATLPGGPTSKASAVVERQQRRVSTLNDRLAQMP